MSNYTLTIYGDPTGNFGHFFIGMRGPDGKNRVVGYYPKGDKEKDDTKNIDAMFGEVPGQVKDDSSRIKNKGVFSEEITLSPEQAAKVYGYLDDVAANPGKYHLKDENCIDFAQGAIDATGIKKNVGELFTDETLDKMGKYSSAGNEARNDDRYDRGLLQYIPKDYLDGEIGGTPGVGSDGNSDKGQDVPAEPPSDSDSETGSGDEQSGVTPDATNTPGAKAFMAEVMKDDDPIDSILQKRPETWTSDEAKQVMYTRSGLPDGDPRVAEIMKLEDAHYKQAYGDGPVKVDDTGKPVDVEPAPAIPSKPVAARDADGTPMKESVARAAKKMVQLAAKDAEKDGPGVAVDKGAHAPVVKQLQGGLNMMSKFAKTPVAGGAESRLKLDGVMGPKTRHRMRDTLSKDGFGRFEEALSLGQFRDFAERSRAGGSGKTLGKEIEGSFANLFRAPKQGGPKIESSVFQESLNEIGSAQPNYTPLKVDGNIGPKTRDTFDLFNKTFGPDKLAGGLGKMFGFFG
jgi:hypothetical protein